MHSPWSWLALACVVLYAGRAAEGWVGGLAYAKGSRLASAGEYGQALPNIDRGAIGDQRSAALWLAGKSRLRLAHQRALDEATSAEGERLFGEAFRDLTEALAMSPASGWYRASLGELYHRREQVERFRYGRPLRLLEHGPWGLVGRPGRIAIGLTRMAIAREPAWFVFEDQLALMMFDDGLEADGLEAVRRSAGLQPRFGAHTYREQDGVSDRLREAFVEGSVAALGKVTLISAARHRIELGRAEFGRGRWEAAVEWLNQALERPTTPVDRAEANFYLGQALANLGRFDEAHRCLREASKQSAFEVAAAAARARAYESAGEPGQALTWLERLEKLEPHSLVRALRTARVARKVEDWPRALRALGRAHAIDPTRPEPLAEQIEILIRIGDFDGAEGLLAQLEAMPGTKERARQLRKRLGSWRK